ncbi:hypothetical protein AGR6A_Lc40002 [Agrobacterium sp. NCPPB 925]|nr:hypothetical protein AGR6A_Lc40002 [Agrobacterium sp. NCPPB 925]
MDDQVRGKNAVSKYDDIVSGHSRVGYHIYTAINAVDISVRAIAADQYITTGSAF